MVLLSNLGRGITRSFSGIVGFFRNSFQELKKVRWPSNKEMVRYTAVVIISVFIISLYLFGVDWVIDKLINLMLK